MQHQGRKGPAEEPRELWWEQIRMWPGPALWPKGMRRLTGAFLHISISCRRCPRADAHPHLYFLPRCPVKFRHGSQLCWAKFLWRLYRSNCTCLPLPAGKLLKNHHWYLGGTGGRGVAKGGCETTRCRIHRHGKFVPTGEGKKPLLTWAFKANRFK